MATAKRTTLYLRAIPVDVVREAKAAAARQGSTLGAFVTESLERTLGTSSADPASPDELRDEMGWYEQHRAQLLRKYRGKYVAIVDRRVLDHDADFSALAERVFERLGVRPVFMPRVTEKPNAVRVRSPRRSPS